MFLQDLSSYRYHRCDGLEGVLPVGWLSSQHHFPTGHVTPTCVEMLTRLAVFKSTNFMRGIHRCDFCHRDDVDAVVDGIVRRLGSAEVWIPGDGVLYASPNLILHYITEHSYEPPPAYLHALRSLDFDAWAPPQDYVTKHRRA